MARDRAEFITAVKAAKEGKPELLKVFVNTLLGETWDTIRKARTSRDLKHARKNTRQKFPSACCC
jgi:hypothetical protein